MIDKETAIELAEQAGVIPRGHPCYDISFDAIQALCNLAAKHAQKDAEPVAWIAKQEDGGLLLWDASYKLIQEGYDLGFNKNSRRLKYYPLYTHPAHDDTALLRQALEVMLGADCIDTDMVEVILALRERLGEK